MEEMKTVPELRAMRDALAEQLLSTSRRYTETMMTLEAAEKSLIELESRAAGVKKNGNGRDRTGKFTKK